MAGLRNSTSSSKRAGKGDISHQAISSYFIGPRAENLDHFRDNIETILKELENTRLDYFKEGNAGDQVEKPFISKEIRESPEFKRRTARVAKAVKQTARMLGKHSIPFWSPRYQAHMCTDLTMPSLLGYFMTMIYNPNNIALEASPLSTVAEIEVGEQLCELFGYNANPDKTGEPVGWGHITSGGTVANIESIWVARNQKFYPLALHKAMCDTDGGLQFVPEGFSVKTCQGKTKRFRDLDCWELLNLRSKTILDIPGFLHSQYGITPAYLDEVMKKYSIQSTGKAVLEQHFDIKKPVQYMVPATCHYSWVKGAAILGMGSDNMVKIELDKHARADLKKLEAALEFCLENKQAVYAVVAVIGTTEEGAVDRLSEILALRQRFQGRGLSFLVHADAAWGGYYPSMLPRGSSSAEPIFTPDGEVLTPSSMAGRGAGVEGFVPDLSLKLETQEDLYALRYCDSITADPHKSGYCPYPAGALAYRDKRMRLLVTWTADYLSGGSLESIGIFGVEGSKPGAAPVATWLSHQCIGLDQEGHGALLAETCFTSSRLSALWAAMSTPQDSFVCVPLNMLPSELAVGDTNAVEAEKKRIRDEVLSKSNAQIAAADRNRPAADRTMTLLRALGSDLNINAFALNFRHTDGCLNRDVEEANYFMKRALRHLSVDDPDDDPTKIGLFLTSTVFSPELYGECAETFKARLGLEHSPNTGLLVLRNVVMSPFATEHDFINRLGAVFREVVEAEVKVSQARNDESPDHHSFWVRGSGEGQVFLSYRPMFHVARHRRQVILAVQLDDKGTRAYREIKGYAEDEIVIKTAEKLILQDLLQGGGKRFVGNLATKSNGIIQSNITIKISSVLKNRHLGSASHDATYPAGFMPFYLYGTPEEHHIDHLLVKCPSIALSAGNVTLTLKDGSSSIPRDILEKGAILSLDGVHEAAMQPFAGKNADLAASPSFFFRPGGEFAVRVWADPRAADEGAGGLVGDVVTTTGGGQQPIASGTLTLGEDLLADVEKLNWDPYRDPERTRVGRWRRQFKKIGQEVEAVKG